MRLGTLEAARRTLLLAGRVVLSSRTLAVRPVAKEYAHLAILSGQPCARRRRRRRPGRTALKAPLISTVRTVEISFLSLPQASSISCVRQVV